jgi:hypothetical protein
MVEKARRGEHPPSIGDNMENIIKRMMAVPRAAGTAGLKAQLGQTIEEEGLQKFSRVYTDGSVMEDRVGCSVICGPEEIKIRLAKHTCIFNAEPIKATRRWGNSEKKLW